MPPLLEEAIDEERLVVSPPVVPAEAVQQAVVEGDGVVLDGENLGVFGEGGLGPAHDHGVSVIVRHENFLGAKAMRRGTNKLIVLVATTCGRASNDALGGALHTSTANEMPFSVRSISSHTTRRQTGHRHARAFTFNAAELFPS